MKHIISLGLILFSQSVFATGSVNDNDKKDIYKISKAGGEIVGEVKVESEFVGTPVMESTKIIFSIECAQGYKLDPKLKKTDSFRAYDYGANGKLSSFDVKKMELQIFFRTALMKEGSPVFDKEKSLTIDLSKACTK